MATCDETRADAGGSKKGEVGEDNGGREPRISSVSREHLGAARYNASRLLQQPADNAVNRLAGRALPCADELDSALRMAGLGLGWADADRVH